MNISALVKDFGLPVGLLLGALYYIVFKTVPSHVYDDVCEDRAAMRTALIGLVTGVGRLLDREEQR